MPEKSLTVIGAGSYGTALAISSAANGCRTLLFAKDPKAARALTLDKENSSYLPGIAFPPLLKVTSSFNEALEHSSNILVVVPSHSFAEVLQNIKGLITPKHRIAWATKGLDQSGDLLSNVAKKILPEGMEYAAFSGPTFAGELARGLPTAIAVAGTSRDYCAFWAGLMHTPTFRIYESHDLIGLQLGGAVKNIIAIAAGMSDGLGYGANSRTALITRGLAEMIRLGVAMGATEHSFMGLSGLGDLVLTCTDDQSRNRRFGFSLGRGISVSEALHQISQVVEGYDMTRVVNLIADRMGVSMPICHELYGVLYEGRSGMGAARALLSRALTKE